MVTELLTARTTVAVVIARDVIIFWYAFREMAGIKLSPNLLALLRERSFSLVILIQLLNRDNLLSQYGKGGTNRTLLIMGQGVTPNFQRLKRTLWSRQ